MITNIWLGGLTILLVMAIAINLSLWLRRHAPEGGFFSDSDRAAGIFGSIGSAAAGQIGPNGEVIRVGAGPALVLSFILLGGCCALAGLCYAELASMIPQAGSAYAYSYATLGEVVAWIIGWDLILEYAVGNVAVAISWGDYFKSLLGDWIAMPDWL